MPVDEATARRLVSLTRRVRNGDESADQQRARLLEAAGVCARVRDDDDGTTLVLYPASWIGPDGRVDPASIDAPDEALELPLSAPARTEDAWPAIDAHNRAVADAVRERHGPVHGATADALAIYLGNHHLRRVEAATTAELHDFREEYFVRNAWPSEEQRALLDRSIELAMAVAREVSAGEHL